jgi:predicted nuclease with TOPRIM domain
VDLSPYIGTIVSVVLAFVGIYGMVSTRLARTEQKIDDLHDTVDRHNHVVERTHKIEADLNTAFKRIDELRAQDEKLEAKMEKLHEKE